MDLSKGGHVARREPLIQRIKGEKKNSHLGEDLLFSYFSSVERGREGEKKKRKKKSKLLSSIYGVPSVLICWAKNESSSTRRGLRVGYRKH